MAKTVKDAVYSCSHTRTRIMERYFLNTRTEDYQLLCKKIRQCDCKTINEEPTNNQIVFEVMYEDIPLWLVWNTEKEYITTALPNPELCDTCYGQKSVPSGAPVECSYDDSVNKYCPKCLGTGRKKYKC